MSYWNEIKLSDTYGFQVENTPMGEQRVIEPVRLVGSTFEGSVWNPIFYTTGATGTGAAVTLGGGWAVLSAGTTSAGTATLQSVRKARYTGASSNRYRAQINMSALVATNHINRWGAFDGANGCFFQTSGTTWSVVTRSNSADTVVNSSSWSDSTTTPTETNCNSYEIYWTNKSVYFAINDVLVHKKTATTIPWSQSKSFPTRAESINQSGTTNYNLNIWVATISRLGKLETDPMYNYISGTSTNLLKSGAGNLHSIIVTDNVGTLTIYDSLTAGGTQIAVIDAAKVIGSIEFHVPFSNGLTVVSATNAKCTVVYE